MKVVLVKWLDATRTDDTMGAFDKVGVIRETVGWLLHDNEDGVILTMSRDFEGTSYERGFTIPKPYIKSKTVLQK